MNDNHTLRGFEETAYSELEITLADTISRNVESFTTRKFTVGGHTFGTEEIKIEKQGVPTIYRRDVPIRNVRRDLKLEKTQWKRFRSIKKND